MKQLVSLLAFAALGLPATGFAQIPEKPVGAHGRVGCLENPKRVERLLITSPGVYENYLVDSEWAGGNRVKITADGVTLRNCEIRNATGNGVGVFATGVVIASSRIHHLLAGSFEEQHDAHGITGRWGDVTIRNCEIYYVSGDAVQFDPDRRSTGRVVIEDSTFWTGPLPADAGAFRKDERPGENAVDTKTLLEGPRAKLVIRNCLFYGWRQPGQIGNMAALNIKENVDARVERCLFRDNEICFRLRGVTSRGGAQVAIWNCAVYESEVGVRMERDLSDLAVEDLGFGDRVMRRFHRVGDGSFPAYRNRGEHEAPPFEQLRARGFPPSATFVFEDFEHAGVELPEGWWVEGGEKVWIEDGRLRVKADPTGEDTPGHVCTVWSDEPLSGDLQVDFDAHVVGSTLGVNNINFFLFYSDPAGKPLYDSRAERSDADYGRYHDLNGYIFTFLNAGAESGNKARVRMRRCPGFELLAETHDYHCRQGTTYHVTITRKGGRISFAVDGTVYLEAEDASPWREGLFGLRTFRTDLWWDNIRVRRLD
jgi:hypothetical protein